MIEKVNTNNKKVDVLAVDTNDKKEDGAPVYLTEKSPLERWCRRS